MGIITPNVESCLSSVTPQEDPVLEQMEEQARRDSFPIVGPLVGRLLFQLVTIGSFCRVLELGSGFGYSACWFALALGKSGEITLTEFSEKNILLAKDYFQKGKVQAKADFRQGDALEILEELQGQFDIVFNDVDKHRYPEVFRKAAPLVRRGGLLISDNILWQGRVASPDPDESTRGILEYTRIIFQSSDFFPRSSRCGTVFRSA